MKTKVEEKIVNYRYVIFAVDHKRDFVMLNAVETDEQVKNALAEEIHKAPGSNIQVCMVN